MDQDDFDQTQAIAFDDQDLDDDTDDLAPDGDKKPVMHIYFCVNVIYCQLGKTNCKASKIRARFQ